MPRQPRIEYPGAIYHVMARGDRNEPIFTDDSDREMFLRTMDEVVERSGWKVYAWVLMSNHYHWAIQTPEANLVAGMGWFQNTYTRRFNTRHKVWGHLFGGRYKAIPVEAETAGETGRGGDYLRALIDYIHLNPARAGLISREKKLTLVDYPWSSLSRGYAVPACSRRAGMAAAEGLDLFGYRDDEQGRRAFLGRAEERAEAETAAESPSSAKGSQRFIPDRGWYWGGEAFREKLLALAKQTGVNRNYRSSLLVREQDRCSAEEWVERGKKHFGIRLPAEGTQHRPERIAIAWALHRKTNQPQAWIANTLGLRSAANVSQQVRRFEREIDDKVKAQRRKPLISEWIAFVRSC